MIESTKFRKWICAVAVATACSTMASTAALAEPQKGGVLRYANQAGPGTLDPYVSSSAVELEIIHHLYDSLVTVGENYETRPMIAKSIDIADEGKTFTFKLRTDVKFHDGSTLTSADAVASFERYRKISPNAVIFNDVASVDAPDPETFIVKLNKTNAVFVDILKSPVYPFVILPASQKDKPARGIDIVGTGPYKLGEWSKDSHLVLQRFDGYVPNPAYKGKGTDGYAGERIALLDEIRYRFIPEANARVAALQSGEVDVIQAIPPDLAKRLDGNANVVVQTVFPYCMQVFVVNSSQGPTANPKIRQAINAVVDADEITVASGSVAKPNHSLVYSFSPYYQGDAMKAYYSQANPEKAKKLLTEAGYKGETITLQSTSNYPHFRASILVLSEMMKDAGMNVKVDIVDWTTNASNMQRGTGTWNVSTTSFCSNPLLGPQQWRTMLYTFPQVKNDKTMDDAYEKFYTSLDEKDRKLAWDAIEKQVLEQAYMIKIADVGVVNAYSKKVEGMKPFTLIRYWNTGLAK